MRGRIARADGQGCSAFIGSTQGVSRLHANHLIRKINGRAYHAIEVACKNLLGPSAITSGSRSNSRIRWLLLSLARGLGAVHSQLARRAGTQTILARNRRRDRRLSTDRINHANSIGGCRQQGHVRLHQCQAWRARAGAESERCPTVIDVSKVKQTAPNQGLHRSSPRDSARMEDVSLSAKNSNPPEG